MFLSSRVRGNCRLPFELYRDERVQTKSHYLAIKKWVVLAYREQKQREENLIRGDNYGILQQPKKVCTEYPE